MTDQPETSVEEAPDEFYEIARNYLTGTPLHGPTKPTIHELEEILAGQQPAPIELLPSGEVRARVEADDIRLLADLFREAAEQRIAELQRRVEELETRLGAIGRWAEQGKIWGGMSGWHWQGINAVLQQKIVAEVDAALTQPETSDD